MVLTSLKEPVQTDWILYSNGQYVLIVHSCCILAYLARHTDWLLDAMGPCGQVYDDSVSASMFVAPFLARPVGALFEFHLSSIETVL